jgi:hypothetical protein
LSDWKAFCATAFQAPLIEPERALQRRFALACVFRAILDVIPILFGQHSDSFWTLFRFNSDSVPGVIWTVFRHRRNGQRGRTIALAILLYSSKGPHHSFVRFVVFVCIGDALCPPSLP